MLLNPFKFHSPQKLEEAVSLYNSLPGVRILAGGTFLINNLKLLKKKGLKTPENIISLRRIDELKGISCHKKELSIKALTSVSELYSSLSLLEYSQIFKAVSRNLATTPIRNMATIGGNLMCRYCWTEFPALLIALKANLHFIATDLKEEAVPVEEFFKNSAKSEKILTRVTLTLDPQNCICYQSVRKSSSVDIPLLAVCIKTKFSKKRFSETIVAVNNGTSFARRDSVLENFLNQSECSIKTADESSQHLDTSLYDASRDDYKEHMFRVTIKNTLRELMTGRHP
ncbi:MAG: FAD binding domain-containing protein [Candidatus Omnitrophota bacterium]